MFFLSVCQHITGLKAIRVEGDVTTVAGDVELLEGTHVVGAARIESGGRGMRIDSHEPTQIVLGPDVVVEGGVEFEREGILCVHESTRVSNGIEGVEPQSFSGERPPLTD